VPAANFEFTKNIFCPFLAHTLEIYHLQLISSLGIDCNRFEKNNSPSQKLNIDIKKASRYRIQTDCNRFLESKLVGNGVSQAYGVSMGKKIFFLNSKLASGTV